MTRPRHELALALGKYGYGAIDHLRTEQQAGDWFEARLLGRRALIVRGRAGVKTFYDPQLVTRKGSLPAPIRLLLFGPGAIHALDGGAHRERKKMFLSIVAGDGPARLAAELDGRFGEALADWQRRGEVGLFDELASLYGQAALAWAGIEISDESANRLSRELALIVDGFGIRGTNYPRAVLARVRAHRWAKAMVDRVRRGDETTPSGSALDVIARSTLTPTEAATELLNVVRPTVAVAYFGAFAAHALARHPSSRQRLAQGDHDELRAFEHEVRRYYPFVPLLAGRLRRDLQWDRGELRPRDWIILDVQGTNRDPDNWADPDEFRPERFLDQSGHVIEPDAWEYVPHGGGHVESGHRCPGESLAAAILEVTLERLSRVDLDVETLEVPTLRIPSRPPHRMPVRVRGTWNLH